MGRRQPQSAEHKWWKEWGIIYVFGNRRVAVLVWDYILVMLINTYMRYVLMCFCDFILTVKMIANGCRDKPERDLLAVLLQNMTDTVG